jgi:hypothetical protein
MNGLDLTKNQKKLVRQLIEIGLTREFENGISKIDRIIQRWKDSEAETNETYYQIYEKLNNFDKHIGQRYNGMSGSNYLFVLASQFADGVITVKDLEVLDEDLQHKVFLISRIKES